MASINLQKIRFAEEYYDRAHGESAAIAAGYSRNGARSKASQLLRDPEVLEHLKELQDEAKALATVTRERLIQELEAIALANMEDFVQYGTEEEYVEPDDEGEAGVDQTPKHADKITYTASNQLTRSQKAAIAEIVDSPKTGFKLKLHSKLDAIKVLNSMQGYDAPVKTETTVTVANLEKTTFSIKARAEDPE